MPKIKGCVNKQCEAYKKKVTYKKNEEYCSKCGHRLVYVCKKCYKPISEKNKYCIIHQAEQDDEKAKRKKVIVGVGGAVLGIGALVCAGSKNIIEHIVKIK